jgi:glutamyl-tRNA synthetase
VRPRLEAKRVAVTAEPDLRQVVALYKERVATLAELADAARPALAALKARPAAVAWERGALNEIPPRLAPS